MRPRAARRVLLAGYRLATNILTCVVLFAIAACTEHAPDGPKRADASSLPSDAGWEMEPGRDAGDDPQTLTVQPLMYTDPSLAVRLLHDGDAIELWRAPQGGHVVLVGARVGGLESDVIELKARLRDPVTGVIVAQELRTVVMQPVPEQPSLLETDRRTRSQVAHVAVCPDYDPRDVVGAPHDLEVLVTELYADFSSGSATVSVVPSCLQTDPGESAECRCECSENYTLGKCADAGP